MLNITSLIYSSNECNTIDLDILIKLPQIQSNGVCVLFRSSLISHSRGLESAFLCFITSTIVITLDGFWFVHCHIQSSRGQPIYQGIFRVSNVGVAVYTWREKSELYVSCWSPWDLWVVSHHDSLAPLLYMKSALIWSKSIAVWSRISKTPRHIAG